MGNVLSLVPSVAAIGAMGRENAVEASVPPLVLIQNLSVEMRFSDTFCTSAGSV